MRCTAVVSPQVHFSAARGCMQLDIKADQWIALACLLRLLDGH